MSQAQLHDTIDVELDGETVQVFNWVNVRQGAFVRGYNPVVEKFDATVCAGDASFKPEAVTAWVAEELRDEFGIDPSEHGIRVIDVESDEVTRL